MTVNKITKAPTQNEIINAVNDLIDNKQDTLIAGTDLEIVNATTPRLPAGFTELEWLQSDGACCIDLGVVSYGNDEVEQKFQRPGTFSGDVISWFGSIQNSAVPRFSIGASSSSGIFAGFNFTKPLVEYDNNIHIITLKKIGSTYYAGIDGEVVSYAPTSASTNPSINSYLFARNGSTITYDGTGTRIFYHKQNRFGGTPLLDIVPARRDSDNALGIYNLVSNTFSGNIGTGTLTGGPEVIYPTTTTINFTNDSGYTTNIGTVTSVNNTQPDANGDVTLTMPTVNDGILTITQNGTSKGTFSANQSTNGTIALTDTTYNAFTGADGTNAGSSGLVPAPSATDNDKYLKGDGTWASVSGGSSTDVQINGTSITSGGVANIITNSAYDASSNKIATMSDLPSTSGFLENTATGNNALTILGNSTASAAGLNIGTYSTCSGNNSIAIGNGDSSTNCTTATGAGSIAIGYKAKATSTFSMQIGEGTNSTSHSLSIGFNYNNSTLNYKLLDGTTGLIPDARISTNIARTSQIPSTSGLANTSLSNLSSTGKKVIDGQWVQSYHGSLVTATSAGSSQASISSYLPSDNYDYEVMFYLTANYDSSACDVAIGNIASPLSNDCIRIKGRVRNTAASVFCTGIIPIKSSARIIYTQRGAKVNSFQVDMIAYRRIGTNS